MIWSDWELIYNLSDCATYYIVKVYHNLPYNQISAMKQLCEMFS